MGGRKKKKKRTVIFCYYCDRHFDNEKVLIEHQRGKHFKCPICHRRLSSARGMMIHVFQVHKESIDQVPHSKNGRDSFELEIFGMVGVPYELIQEKMVKIYGEPAAKKQKVQHQVASQGIQMPGMGGASFQGYQVPGVVQPFRMVPVAQPGFVQQGMFGQPMQAAFRPQPGMMQMQQRGMPLQHPGMRMQPHQNTMPPPRQPGRMPPPGPNMQHMQGPPPVGMPGPGMPGAPMQPPQQMQPMAAPQIQRNPISEHAKADIVDRQEELVQSASLTKRNAKKKINRIFDRVGVCMEELRSQHVKYKI